MTEDEKLEFRTAVTKTASEIVSNLMKSELGGIDSAFCLGAAVKLISGVLSRLQSIPLAQAEKSVLEAFNAGFKNTEAQVILIDDSKPTH